MIALETLLSKNQRFLGLIGFSGGFLGVKSDKINEAVKTPILLIHGDSDPVVPFEMTESSLKTLSQKGFKVEKHICKGLAHGISVEGLSRASEFIKNL